jgi:hypothetical protein
VDVAAWLRGLGLEHYEPAFRDNGIDAEALPKLTVDDLKNIGVTRVGDRRKLLEAIAALREGAPLSRTRCQRPRSGTGCRHGDAGASTPTAPAHLAQKNRAVSSVS